MVPEARLASGVGAPLGVQASRAGTSPGGSFPRAKRICRRTMGLSGPNVLRRWNITSTLDFGQIVFSLVRHNEMSVTEADRLEDFKDVLRFKNRPGSPLPHPHRARMSAGGNARCRLSLGGSQNRRQIIACI